MVNPLVIVLGGGVVALLLASSSKKASASTATSSTAAAAAAAAAPGTPVTVVPPTPVTTPRVYKVQSGDYPAIIAEAFTGDKTRWPELIRANPQKPAWTSAEKAALKGKPEDKYAQVGNFKTLYAGENLYLPTNW